MFHALCWNCADCLIGGTNSDRSAPAWRQAYRAVEHGFARNQCEKRHVVSRFPAEIQDFAALFKSLQEKRNAADYDPFSRFSKTDADTMIDTAELAISRFRRSSIKDRRAFAAWTTMKNRSD